MTKELVEVVQAKRIETVTGDFLQDPGEPFWRIEIDGYCADFDYEAAANNFAAAINARIASARLSAEAAIVAWQPFETAPQKGTIIVGRGGDFPFVEVLRWRLGEWLELDGSRFRITDERYGPLYWMPLPAPPADTLEQGKQHG